MCAAADIERVYNLPMPHRKVRLSFDFFAIDTWDGPWHGEVGRASVDGVLVWSQQFAGNVGTHECGLSLSGWHLDQHAAVSVELAHVTSTVRVRIDTNVNGSPSDECVQDWPLNPMGLFTPPLSCPTRCSSAALECALSSAAAPPLPLPIHQPSGPTRNTPTPLEGSETARLTTRGCIHRSAAVTDPSTIPLSLLLSLPCS